MKPRVSCLRYAGVVRFFFFLIGDLYLIDVCLGESQRTNTIKPTCLKEIELLLQIIITVTHPTTSTNRKTYIFNEGIKKNMRFRKSQLKQGRFDLQSIFLLMLHHRFHCVNFLYLWKLENEQTEPNDTHTP